MYVWRTAKLVGLSKSQQAASHIDSVLLDTLWVAEMASMYVCM